MPNISLTELGAKKQRPAATDIIYWDKNLPGFGLRVSSKGVKSFLVQYRVRQEDGTLRERQEVLGRLSYMTVAQARDKAREAKVKASSGVDPVAQKRAAKAAAEVERKAAEFTLAKFVEAYTAKHIVKLKPGGQKTLGYLLSRCVRALGDRQADSITKKDVIKFRDDLFKGRSDGTAQADSLVLALRRLYRWGMTRDLVTHDPTVGIPKEHDDKGGRDRVLSDDEIVAFWQACDHIDWPAAPVFRLLLLLACRSAELGGLRWSEVSLEKREITLPGERTKNGRTHTIPLSDMALAILKAQRRIPDCEYVFSYSGKTAFNSFTENRQRVQRLMGAGTPDFVVHDLRRTAATLLAKLGIRQEVTEKVLNHQGKISGIAAIYNRYEFETEKREALDKLAAHIATLIGRDQGNVVQLPAAAE